MKKWLVLALAFICASLSTAIAPAEAGRGSVPSANYTHCPYPVDNGCAAVYSVTMPSNGQSFLPFFRDANFVFDNATSGQVPVPSNGGYAAAVTTYTNFLHHNVGGADPNAFNIPGWDYPVGSADPRTLKPITQFPTDHPGSPCTLYMVDINGASTGPLATGGLAYNSHTSYLYCLPATNSTAVIDDVQGYDFSNCGLGTKTCFVLLAANQAHGTGQADLRVMNNYWFCNNLPAQLPTATSGPCKQRNNITNLYDGQSKGSSILTLFGGIKVEFTYNTFDEDFDNQWGLVEPAGGIKWITMIGVNDARQYNALGPTVFDHNYLHGLSGDFHQSGQSNYGGSTTFSYNAFIGTSLGGFYHMELSEQGGWGANANITYTGNIYVQRAGQSSNRLPYNNNCANCFFDITGPEYAVGAENNSSYNWTTTNNVMVINSTGGCLGHPPWNAANPCGWVANGGDGGLIVVSTLISSNMVLAGNVVDDSQGIGVYEARAGFPGPSSSVITNSNNGTDSFLDIYNYDCGSQSQGGCQEPGGVVTMTDSNGNNHFPGWIDAKGDKPVSLGGTSTFDPLYAQFQAYWCNWTGSSCSGSGTTLHTTFPINMTIRTSITCTSANVPDDGCVWTAPADGSGSAVLGNNQILGYATALAASCLGVSPCTDWVMSSSQSYTSGTDRFISDNFTNPASAFGCQAGVHRNCGRIVLKNVVEPAGAVAGNTMYRYTFMDSMTVGPSPTLYAQPGGGVGNSYSSPHTVTFSLLPVTPPFHQAGLGATN